MDSNPSDQHHQTNNNNHQSENNNNTSVQEQCNSEEGNSHQPPPPVSPGQHPGAVGYAVAPPAIRYPYPPLPGQIPHNYQHYPSLPSNYVNHANYPHAQAPPAPYYYANPNNVNFQNYPYALPARDTPSFRFLRAIMVFIMILLIFVMTCSYITNLLYHPLFLTFHVDAFSVSNFNASSPSGFSSTWDVSLSVKNCNTKLKANFEGGNTNVYYQGNMDEFMFSYVGAIATTNLFLLDKNVLASSFVQPFDMETGEVTTLTIRMAAGKVGNAAVVAKDVMAEMADEKATTGAVIFGLRLRLETMLKSDHYSKDILFEVDCNKLKVVFYNNGSSSDGSLVADDDQRECDVIFYD